MSITGLMTSEKSEKKILTRKGYMILMRKYVSDVIILTIDVNRDSKMCTKKVYKYKACGIEYS